jgi:hypothetical protein
MRSPYESAEPFTIRPEQKSAVDGEIVVTGYSMAGNVIDAKSDDCVAKKAYDPATTRTRHWVKRATAGADAGNLFNPHSPDFNPDAVNRVHHAMGRGQYEFRPVTSECFDLYMRFLTTGNVNSLRYAERANS